MEELLKKLRVQKLLVLIIALVLVASIVAGYLVYENNQNNSKNAVPKGWAEYKNSKFNLEFIYPKAWGEPTLKESSVKKGKQYDIGFNSTKSSDEFKNQVGITMQTDDYLREVCQPENNCISIDGFNSKTVKKILQSDKKFLAKYDSSSYATVKANTLDTPIPRLSSGLDYYQIVNLQEINVSAVHAIYNIQGDNQECPLYKLSANSNNKCVTQKNYDDLVNVVKSIKTLE